MIGEKIDEDKLWKEVIDLILKENYPPADKGKPKDEIKTEKRKRDTEKRCNRCRSHNAAIE